MFFSGFFTAIYLFIALCTLLMTYDEYLRNKKKPDILIAALSFVACLFWPITLLLVAMMVTTQRRDA